MIKGLLVLSGLGLNRIVLKKETLSSKSKATNKPQQSECIILSLKAFTLVIGLNLSDLNLKPIMMLICD